MKRLHLICNAHLDPVWLWQWEEGAAEAMSTFRVAADFCDKYGGFIFNHNEVILYKWVEEYEPELFKRIQRLVREGKWHIMGGWYLQPDCNMPSGESFVRQILLGRKYFKNKFGVEPSTAINFDPFGHTRGLVQILTKSGYDSYLFCRPGEKDCALPEDDFVWVGFDGSEIIGHRAYNSYLTARGDAHNKIREWMDSHKGKSTGLVLWGVGNHGGGPSEIDMANISELMKESCEYEPVHSTPEAYFRDLKQDNSGLPRYDKDLNPFDVGCYTSQVRVKQKHRLLENEIYMVEKMLASASIQGYLRYPKEEIDEAIYDLMLSEFHDILPGSSIQPVEEDALRLMNHGLEITSRLKTRAFFALSSGQKKAEEGTIPVMVYNPHPFKVNGIFECEFQLPDQNYNDGFSFPVVYQKGERIACQAEKELSNLNLDWRKRVVFLAELEPSQMNRFDCKINVLKEKPEYKLKNENGMITFKTEDLEVRINCETGLVDKYIVKGFSFLKPNSFMPLVVEDNDDPWGMTVQEFRNIEGSFKLMDKEEGSKFSGVKSRCLDSVRVIEDGEVRSVIETVFKYGDSFICQQYKLPKKGTEIEVLLRVYWNEKSKMLKLSVPTVFTEGKYIGQVAYGVEQLPDNGKEVVSQKWSGIFSDKDNRALTCINDGVYGSDYFEGELRVSLIRSAGYSGHPILDRPIMVQDRFSPRIDQGERIFTFWFNGGDLKPRREKVDREALLHNEKPYAVSFFPPGIGNEPTRLIELSSHIVQMTSLKRCERSDDYIVRLFNPSPNSISTEVAIPFLDLNKEVNLGKYEIKTMKIKVSLKTMAEVSLLED